MRKLLNTLYITNEDAYLSLDGENLVCKVKDETALRIPFDNFESVVCFSYIGVSPALMGKCVNNNVPIAFISPQGRFLAKICGETKGNVFLRVQQIERFRTSGLDLTKNTLAAKFSNTRQLIKRSQHDNIELRNQSQIVSVLELLKNQIERIYDAKDIVSAMGIEGMCAKEYFSIFGLLISREDVDFSYRSKRPPLDAVNAVLSFIYTLLTNEYASALETVGLDSYIGYCHSLRSGRASLACDMVEETRCIAERFTLTLFNLGIISAKDFSYEVGGAVFLNTDGKKKVITKWQEKKRKDIKHPYTKEKIPWGLLPYVQANLLAKYVRGDIDEYPSFLIKSF